MNIQITQQSIHNIKPSQLQNLLNAARILHQWSRFYSFWNSPWRFSMIYSQRSYSLSHAHIISIFLVYRELTVNLQCPHDSEIILMLVPSPQIKFNCTELIHAWNTSVSPISDMDVLQTPVLNEAEGDGGSSLSISWVISHWSINSQKSKIPVFCSKVPRSKSNQCHQQKATIPSLPFLSPPPSPQVITRWVTYQPPSHPAQAR